RIQATLASVLWPLVAILPSLVAMRGMFSNDQVYCFRDIPLIYFPVHRWFRQTAAAGVLPLWAPYLALGQSATAAPWRNISFPPGAALGPLRGEVRGFTLTTGLAIPVAALGVYVLLRNRLSGQASAFGAIVFSASATLLSGANMPNFEWAVALIPWTVW